MIPVVVAALIGWGCALGLTAAWLHRPERLISACHEIRGPLTAAQLALHASARRGELAPTTVAALELELRRAALAVDELLGRSGSAGAEVQIDALLNCQAQTWQDVASAHGRELKLRTEASGALVHGDAVRMAQAVGNVLANAIEHGAGRIELRTRRVGNRVRVEVTDDGGGLPAPVAELVAGGRRRGLRGRGLGIAARAVERDGGRLVSLPSPRGARLALELPLASDVKGDPLAA